MKTRFSALSIPLIAALVAGCGAMQSAAEPPILDGTAWVLSSIPGWALVSGAPVSLRFEEGRALGSDGCNRYSVGYTAVGPAVSIPAPAASTRMACPPGVMKQAEAFVAALTGAASYRIEGGQLQLMSADGKLRATLVAQPQALAGTRWRATGINNGKGAVASLVDGSTVTMTFAADGRASGSAGCNDFTARYEASGSRLRLRSPAPTHRSCAGERLMEQERQFLKALEAVTTMRVEGDRLELRDVRGALMASLVREG